MPYSKLYILTELVSSDVKFISVDRQKLDLSIYIYTYGTVNSIYVEIQSDSTNIKKWPSYVYICTGHDFNCTGYNLEVNGWRMKHGNGRSGGIW